MSKCRGLNSHTAERGIYTGGFDSRGRRQGKGIFYFDSGDIYEGSFHRDFKHGIGTYKYAAGSSSYSMYNGNWKMDNIHGKGVLTFSNGDKYSGDFLNDEMHGNGVYEFSNGNV